MTIDDKGLYLARRTSQQGTGDLQAAYVRDLTPFDLESYVSNSAPLPNAVPSVKSIRASHHQLAQLLARGVSHTEASLITGYAVATVHNYSNNDPAFKELVAFYTQQRDLAFADVMQKMSTLGSDVLDILKEQIDESPQTFTKRELMELVDLTLVKPNRVPGGMATTPTAGAGVVVNVKFTSPKAEDTVMTIDGSTVTETGQ